MPERRKRLKSSHSVFAEGKSVAAESIGSFESAGNSLQDCLSSGMPSTMFESGSFACRCSVRTIYEVVSKFDDVKKELVRSIGFDGILEFPSIKQIDRKFSLWLMSCVDEKSSSLRIGDDVCIGFNKFDVGHVFGIPAGGKCVLDSIAARSDAKEKVIGQYLDMEFKEQRSTKLVQEIIERDYGMGMSKQERDTFRVAFVVLVSSNLMSPSTKYNYASVDYWNAIEDPEKISSYDWCGFVITKLLEGVAKLKLDIMNNIKFPNLSGCALFLQVLYLDSIDLEGLSMPHNKFPRVTVFSTDTLMKLISVDKNYARHCMDDSCLPVAKVRDPRRCIYSWAVWMQEKSEDGRTGCLLPTWEAALAMVRLLDIPVEAAGPLFVAVFEFQEQINSGLLVTGMQAVKFLGVLVSLMIPFRHGFRYSPSLSCSGMRCGNMSIEDGSKKGIKFLSCPIDVKVESVSMDLSIQHRNGEHCSKDVGDVAVGSLVPDSSRSLSVKLSRTYTGDGVQRPLKRAFSCLDNLPHSLNINLRAATTMAQFYSMLRGGQHTKDFDLNCCEVAESSSASSPTRCDLPVCDNVLSPWELGYQWNAWNEDIMSVVDKVRWMQGDYRLGVIHRDPKYIQVCCNSIYEQLTCLSEMELDLFDALVRVARQEDDLIYSGKGVVRWRYVFESDMLANIIGGMVDLSDSQLRHHLSLSTASYFALDSFI